MSGINGAVKPLQDPCPEDLTAFADPIGRLIDLPDAPGYRQTVEFFTGYPERSLLSEGSRAFLYQAIKALQARFVLEIGTYYAGTTEVLARAVHANGPGSGHVMTIDPYGAERVPQIIEGWPQSLRDITTYAPIDSMGIFIRLERLRPSIDLAFIDGDHEYGFALYDLTMAAKWLRPGGILVLDDASESSVYTAARDFLTINPGWRALGGVFDGFDSSNPFPSMHLPSIRNTGFTVLAAPSHVEIRGKAVSFSFGPIQEPGVVGFTIDRLDGASGTLHANVILRSFYEDPRRGNPDQHDAVIAAEISGEPGRSDVLLDQPSETSMAMDGSWREVELVLLWENREGSGALRLTGKPQIIMLPASSPQE